MRCDSLVAVVAAVAVWRVAGAASLGGRLGTPAPGSGGSGCGVWSGHGGGGGGGAGGSGGGEGGIIILVY